jgi:predicted TIM-barrel fold metal-dependent hydrolase
VSDPRPLPWDGPLVDCDVHVSVGSIETLFDHLAPVWIDFADASGWRAPSALPVVYPAGAPTTCLPGCEPVSSLAVLQRQLLDLWRPDVAILNPYWGLEELRLPDFAAGLASAINDWMIAEWLDRDPRLRASITVVHHDPAEAAREIDRVGGHPGFVQVLLPLWSQMPWGRRIWHPLFAAIERNDLVAGIHFGGLPDGPPTPTGYPSWFFELHVGATQVMFTQILSLVAEGVFEAFPRLRIAILETGFTCLPGLMWRMNKEWKGLRRDVPWVKRPPSETIRERVRFSTQPLDAGPPEELARIIDWLGSDEILMFATDHPHAYDERPEILLEALDPGARAKVMAGNASAHYRL